MRARYLFSFAMAATASSAAAAPILTRSADNKIVYALQGSMAKTSLNIVRPKSKSVTIFSNLARGYPNGLYWSQEGYALFGPKFGEPSAQWVAAPFTPSVDTVAVEVQAAVSYLLNPNSFTFAVYADTAGVPGQVLTSSVFNANYMTGGCCGLVSFKLKGGGLHLKGGTQYWIGFTTDKRQSKNIATWNFDVTDQVTQTMVAVNDDNGQGWIAEPVSLSVAYGVFSK